MNLRSPIVCVLGHVDHGKTNVLDRIRGTSIAAKEAGMITQHVGASMLPKEIIEKKCAQLLQKYNFKITIPGLLFIDTPGHEAFTNLRKRGGSIADLAVLVIDITQGIQPQTIESIEILKANKVPFVVAANKIDLITGWLPKKDACFSETYNNQRDFVKQELDEKIYWLIGKLGELGFNSERFDRTTEITTNVLIIPVSAKTGEGFGELIMFLSGLAQKFMEKQLKTDEKAPARGTVLEVKEVQGLGTTIDAIIYSGHLKKNDLIGVTSVERPIITKVKTILQPAALEEIRDTSKKFKPVDEVYAAAGVKISAVGIDDVVPGSPLIVITDNEEEVKKELENEMKEAIIETDSTGLIIKADALGSLEAIVKLLQNHDIKIRSASIGPLTKTDLLEAEVVKRQNRYMGVIFSFNTKNSNEIKEEAEKNHIKIFESNVIYHLEEEYQKWMVEEKEMEKKEKLGKYIYPAKIRILPGCIFRVSKPAIVGIQVMEGIIKPGYPIMDSEGREIGKIQNVQDKNKSIEKAEKGMEVAISIPGITVGRQIYEDMIIFTCVPLKQLYELQTKGGDMELIKEIIKLKEGNR